MPIYNRFIPLQANVSRLQERVTRWLAWQMPLSLAMWCFVRVTAHATVGEYGNTDVSTITAMDALKRWEK